MGLHYCSKVCGHKIPCFEKKDYKLYYKIDNVFMLQMNIVAVKFFFLFNKYLQRAIRSLLKLYLAQL